MNARELQKHLLRVAAYEADVIDAHHDDFPACPRGAAEALHAAAAALREEVILGAAVADLRSAFAAAAESVEQVTASYRTFPASRRAFAAAQTRRLRTLASGNPAVAEYPSRALNHSYRDLFVDTN